jgi:hypothetical protein
METFSRNILTQNLWGNRFLVYGRKQETLFFKKWIDSGFLEIRHLRFKNGVLDEKYLHTKITKRSNIYREITLLKKKTFMHLIRNGNPEEEHNLRLYIIDNAEYDNIMPKKSIFFYSNLVSQKLVKPVSRQSWSDKLNIEKEDLDKAYTLKIVHIKDKKISEMNFKILHNILPCNKNLLSWKKSNSKYCTVCSQEETIEHLLYNCEYAQSIWKDVKVSMNIEISLIDIICGINLDKTTSFIISLIAFLIYKDWLITSLNNNQHTNKKPRLKLFASVLYLRKWVYQHCSSKWKNICIKLETLIYYCNKNFVTDNALP